MNPLVRAIGKILRLVGISSPEDLPKPKPSTAPPSWRDPQPPKPGASDGGQ
jgi:hypothetical protein